MFGQVCCVVVEWVGQVDVVVVLVLQLEQGVVVGVVWGVDVDFVVDLLGIQFVELLFVGFLGLCIVLVFQGFVGGQVGVVVEQGQCGGGEEKMQMYGFKEFWCWLGV